MYRINKYDNIPEDDEEDYEGESYINTANIIGLVLLGIGSLVVLFGLLLDHSPERTFNFPAAFQKLFVMLFGMWLGIIGALLFLRH